MSRTYYSTSSCSVNVSFSPLLAHEIASCLYSDVTSKGWFSLKLCKWVGNRKEMNCPLCLHDYLCQHTPWHWRLTAQPCCNQVNFENLQQRARAVNSGAPGFLESCRNSYSSLGRKGFIHQHQQKRHEVPPALPEMLSLLSDTAPPPPQVQDPEAQVLWQHQKLP